MRTLFNVAVRTFDKKEFRSNVVYLSREEAEAHIQHLQMYINVLMIGGTAISTAVVDEFIIYEFKG